MLHANNKMEPAIAKIGRKAETTPATRRFLLESPKREKRLDVRRTSLHSAPMFSARGEGCSQISRY